MKHEVSYVWLKNRIHLLQQNTSVVTDVFWQKGEWTKTTPDKTPWTKTPRTIEREFVQGAFVWVFCTRPTKNRGGPRCVTYFWGVPGSLTKCDRGRGGTNWPKIAWCTLWTAPKWLIISVVWALRLQTNKLERLVFQFEISLTSPESYDGLTDYPGHSISLHSLQLPHYRVSVKRS